MKRNYQEISKITSECTLDEVYGNYSIDRRFYCSKCKFFNGSCTLKRITRICRKKRLRNVPIQKD